MKRMQIIGRLVMLLACGTGSSISLTSCQQESIEDSLQLDAREYICFDTPVTSVGVNTRSATDGFLDEFPEGGTFGVLGYCLSQNVTETQSIDYASGGNVWNQKKRLCRPRVFYKTPVTYSNGYCSYASPKRWYYDGPANEQLSDAQSGDQLVGTDDYYYSFFAYYPFEGCWTVDQPAKEEDMGAPKFTFTMPFSNTGIDQELDVNLVPDAMLSVLYNRKRGASKVGFYFSHFLTGLGFQVNNYSQTNGDGATGKDGKNLTIYSIKLQGTFYSKATVDLTESSYQVIYPKGAKYQGTYVLFDAGDEGVEIPFDPSDNKNVLKPEKYLRLLSGTEKMGWLGPDNADGTSDIKVLIDYQFGDEPRVRNKTIGRPSNFAPRAGVRYTAQLNWVGDAFVIIVEPDNNGFWEDGMEDGSGDITFE